MKLARVDRWTVLIGLLVIVVVAAVAYWCSTNECEQSLRPTGREMMRAVVRCDYGARQVLQIAQVPKPSPSARQVLVRVRAAGLNPLDWHYMRGTPYVMRLDTGLRKPSSIRLGVDFAGEVEAVGSQVTRFKPGDAVFGNRMGALAQYMAVSDAGAVWHVPPNLSFAQAAVPVAALTALQALRDAGRIARGHSVLINGASGGVGTFAVQLAKHFGAKVTGVCSTRNVGLVRAPGADHVVDYTREDFTRRAERYDILLDNVGNHSLLNSRRVLTRDGRYVLVGGGAPTITAGWVRSAGWRARTSCPGS